MVCLQSLIARISLSVCSVATFFCFAAWVFLHCMTKSSSYGISGFSQILVETGHIGRQASGAVTVTDGETVSINMLDKSFYFSLTQTQFFLVTLND